MQSPTGVQRAAGRPRSPTLMFVAAAGVVALIAAMPLVWTGLEPHATFVIDLTAGGPVMGTWRLSHDDDGLRARGEPVPETLFIEPCGPGESETLPAGLERGSVARLTSGGASVLFTSQVVFHPFVPGSGSSPFPGALEGVAMMLSLHEWFSGLDSLTIDLVIDGGQPLSHGSRRLTYSRD